MLSTVGRPALARLVRLLRRRGPATVTVVVTVSPQQRPQLGACVQALREQTHPHVAVVAVRHGGERDDAATRGAARNQGARRAGGRYLFFLEATERLHRDALAHLVAAAEDGGADLAVGDDHDRPGHTLAEQPDLVTAATVPTTLVRRSFWAGNELRFDPAPAAPGDAALVAALARAPRVATSTRPVMAGVETPAQHAFGSVPHVLDDLDPWLSAVADVDGLLRPPGLADARRTWLCTLLDRDTAARLGATETATAQQWQALRDVLGPLVSELAADPEAWLRLGWETRVAAWLLAHDRREALADLLAQRRGHGPGQPTDVRSGAVYAAVWPFRDAAVGAPEHCFLLTAEQTPLVASLRQVRWGGDTALELDVFAYVRHVGEGCGAAPELAATLVAGDGRRVELEVSARSDPAATRFAAEPHQDHDRGAFRLAVPADAVVTAPAWTVELSLSVAGLVRTGTLTHRDHNGTVGERPRRLHAGMLWGPSPVGEGGLRLESSPAGVTLAGATVTGRTVRGRLEVPRGAPRPGAVTLTRPDRPPERAPVTGDGAFEATLPDVGYRGPTGSVAPAWRVRAVDAEGADGGEQPVAFPAETAGPWLGEPGGPLAWYRGRHGHAEVQEVARRPLLTDLALQPDDTLVVSLRWLGAAPARWSLALVGDRVRLPGVVHPADGSAVVAVPTTCDEWGLGATTAPCGGYEVELTLQGGADGPDEGAADRATRSLPVAPGLTEGTPVDLVGERVRVRVRQNAGRRLAVHLLPPLADDELGPRAQTRQQRRYATNGRTGHTLDEHAVYLQAYTGQAATDSALAIHERLRRTRPDLRLYWGVADHSVHLPEGAVPVLLRSRDWYDVLASAAYLVNNIDFDAWFTKRAGQRFLQTFHGYPAKSMGLVQWRAKRFTDRMVEAELDRTARTWDMILTPVPEMNGYYRREYGYDGPIHDRGYPRDDALTAPGAELVRAATRRRLGIAPDQTAVLYAPTFRDHLATAHRSAPLAAHLDLEAASAALGEDHVLLARGHRFHARGAQRVPGTRRLVDVTDYPEVNDLILAADVAVLDYSSLRFDFALTGKPMVFLVPDLELYAGDAVRGFLYDFADSAPGPLLRDAEEVVAVLRDVDGLARAHRAEIAAFNQRFQYWQDGHAAARVVDAFFGPPPPR